MIPSFNSLPHALLFVGNASSIEQALNTDLKALLCESHTAQACQTCLSCQLFDSEMGHPDLMRIIPEGKLNVIKIDQVREVISFLEHSAFRGGKRIVVFMEANTLNIAAQNALLKSLEEPGEGTLIILLSAKPYLLLPTIRSRCLTYAIHGNADTHNQALIESLLVSSFEPLQFIESNKTLDPLDCVYTQMVLTHDMMQKKPDPRLSAFYRELSQKSARFQTKVAVNKELSLYELALAWKQVIADNIPH